MGGAAAMKETQMPKYTILKSFKGSPDGIQVIDYTAGEEVELVESLAEVAIKEKWAKRANVHPAGKPTPKDAEPADAQ